MGFFSTLWGEKRYEVQMPTGEAVKLTQEQLVQYQENLYPHGVAEYASLVSVMSRFHTFLSLNIDLAKQDPTLFAKTGSSLADLYDKMNASLQNCALDKEVCQFVSDELSQWSNHIHTNYADFLNHVPFEVVWQIDGGYSQLNGASLEDGGVMPVAPEPLNTPSGRQNSLLMIDKKSGCLATFFDPMNPRREPPNYLRSIVGAIAANRQFSLIQNRRAA